MELINKTEPDLRDKTIARLVKKGGLRSKIDAMCCYCIYDSYGEGNWRQQVGKCTAYECPLFTVRPQSKPVKKNETAK